MTARLSGQNILYLMLIFLPISLVLEYGLHASGTAIFITSALTIIPLAGILGLATEKLSEHYGAGVSGLLNATFGELIEVVAAHGGEVQMHSSSNIRARPL